MTTDCSFVKTAEIKDAVERRETEVLDALGVAWRGGRPHITCPYPSHDDRHPSWRWDDGKSRAYCSCTKSDSIFDVVAKVESCTFDTAKLRVAEFLGRQDLIRTKGRSGNQRYQATDANSLLGAPPENRDDALPMVYLAHRLGIPVEAVPVPTTPVAGLKALDYFDPPPPESKSKPKLVGAWPCAVFGTVAADGGRHAHRIYLAPGGAGKADLGLGPDGRARDAKKSAKKLGDDRTTGRAVLWGDPQQAPWIILCEGIETAAAVAHAVKGELDANVIAVAAAISAGGVEAFQPYAATTGVIVAADRDEAPKPDGRPGSRRGERAARAFGLRHRERIHVRVAMPGAAGESVDWLDVLRRDGAEAVRGGVKRAAGFVPTHEELNELQGARSRAGELKEIEAIYPLPVLASRRLVYCHTLVGKIMIHKVEGSGDDTHYEPVVTPFAVTARLRHADCADAYGLRCRVQDMNGEPRAVDFERATLARMSAAEVKAALFTAGLRVEGDGETVAVQCLKAADPQVEIVVVRRPGWHQLPHRPDPIFLAPDGSGLGAPDGVAIELAASARMPPEVAAGGTLGGWQQAVAAALSITGCPHWTLGIAAAFVGPLIALTGLDSCGINLSGMSSSGKSTAQRLAASAWSSPDLRKPGLMQSARATDNAIEALAQRATGTVLALDELAHLGGKAAGKVIYTIAGGVGKRRMNADAALRDGYGWATFAILSGESSLEEKIRSDGGEWSAGMAVRIVDVDVSEIDRSVDGETLKRINAVEQNYGHAGPAFVQKLIAQDLHRQAAALREAVLTASRAIAGEAADSAISRAAVPFALLRFAGELAKQFDLIPASAAIREAADWAWTRYRQSSDAEALDPAAKATGNLRRWIAERWDVTIKSVDAETGINNREALAWYDETIIYIPKDRIREAAGNALKESHIGAALDGLGLLAQRPERDRYYTRWVPRIGRIPAYALRRSEFGRSRHANDPEAYAVVGGGRHD